MKSITERLVSEDQVEAAKYREDYYRSAAFESIGGYQAVTYLSKAQGIKETLEMLGLEESK